LVTVEYDFGPDRGSPTPARHPRRFTR
jgi:hypothetical protein